MKFPGLPRRRRPDEALRDADGRAIPDPAKVPTARGTWEEAALTNVAGTQVVNRQIAAVFGPLLCVWGVVAAGVAGAIIYSALRFRRKHDDEEPAQTHGNNRLELGWTVIPFVILASLFGLTAANMGVIASAPQGAMNTKATGVRFYWQIDYGVQKANGKELTTIKDVY